MQKITVSLLIALLLLLATVVAAQEKEQEAGAIQEQEKALEEVVMDETVTAQDLNISEPSLLPDSPFYFAKNWWRGIRSFFAFNPVKKAELKERFASEKLLELKKMIKQRKSGQALKKAAQNYEDELERVKKAVERIKQKAPESERVGSFLDKFIRHQALHQRILQKLQEQVPPQAFEKIKEARQRHLQRFGEVMTKLEKNKERLRERLEKNLQKIKGSDFKDFKNAEILQELEEKVPQTAKEAIRKARENVFKRLENKLERLPEEKVTRFKTYLERISGAKEKQAEILEKLKERLKEKPALREKIIRSTENLRTRIQVMKRERGEQKNKTACIQLWDPVCGKNGQTYSNQCFAKLAGVEIAHKGICRKKCVGEGGFCSGLSALPCCPGLTCRYLADYPDAGGECVKKEPEIKGPELRGRQTIEMEQQTVQPH